MKKIYTIGRDEGCDIVIPDTTDVISRLHATIRIESNDKIFLIDQSRNGTYINGMKMSSNVEIPVSRKDVVSFAHIYNLDWSMVPKNKFSPLKMVLIALVSLILLGGAAYAVIGYMNNTESVVPEEIVQTTDPDPVPEDAAQPDTTAVSDTVVPVKEKPQAKPQVEKKDSVKVEQPEEDVYNPIY